MPDSKYGQKWSEDETILAFYYYCKIPFGKIHSRNPEIIRIAELLGLRNLSRRENSLNITMM